MTISQYAGALMFCASQTVSALSKAASSRCSTPGQCFIAGALVLIFVENKKIEDIKVGNEVWAYDEESGERSQNYLEIKPKNGYIYYLKLKTIIRIT